MGGERRDRCGAESFDVARSCRFAVVGSRRPDRVQRRAAAREPARSRWQSADRRRERLCVQAVIHSRVVSQRVLLRLRRQDSQAFDRRRRRADDRVLGDDAGDARGGNVRPQEARLHLDNSEAGARHRAAGDLARRQTDRLCRCRRHLRDAGRRQARRRHEGRGAGHRSRVVARRIAAGLLVRQGERASAALDPRHENGAEPAGDASDHAAAGGHVVARREAHRVLRRERHVARREHVGARCRERRCDEGARHARAAGHTDVVARRKTDRARRSGTVHAEIPRRHESGVDHRRSAALRCGAAL